MESKKYIIHSLEELHQVSIDILEQSKHHVFLFYGDLGAGKTSMIKSLCQLLKIEDLVSSPTYAIINEYIGKEKSVYHMDLYRLKSEEEAFDIGIEDYLYSNNYCFIEWPQIIEHIIDVPFHEIHITHLEDGSRALLFK